MTSPAFRMLLDQPARSNWPGVRPSIAQSTFPPLPSSTDRRIHTWGLVHFHSVTVPLSTITLSPSNAALLWCARTDEAVNKVAMVSKPIFIEAQDTPLKKSSERTRARCVCCRSHDTHGRAPEPQAGH